MQTALLCLRQALVEGTRVLAIAAIAGLSVVLVLLLLFRWVNPPASSLMVQQALTGQAIDQRWVKLEDVAPVLIRSVVRSEDARFCLHYGIDTVEMRAALRRSRGGEFGSIRGASTISMQVVKNMFLWPDRSLARKGLELAITPLMEVVWPKRRILEVYLNIAEWGPGIFGAEAAAQAYFGKSASRLSRREAALMAVALPNPIERRPDRPSGGLQRRASEIARGAAWTGLEVGCL